MSMFQSPIHANKWFCDKCKTWCMNTSGNCPLCSAPKPKNTESKGKS